MLRSRLVRVAVVVIGFAFGVCALQALAQRDDTPQRTGEANLVNAAQAAYTAVSEAFERGQATADDVYRWSKRWVEAADTAPARREHLQRMEQLQRSVAAWPEGSPDRLAVQFYVEEAQTLVRNP